MITIQLDAGTLAGASDPLPRGMLQNLDGLLDRCVAENNRDVTLQLPAVLSPALEPGLRSLLSRPLRFSAWFRDFPTAAMAEIFLSAGHRVTVAPSMAAGDDTFRSRPRTARERFASPILAMGAPWQWNLFLALPIPSLEIDETLGGLELRRGTSLTVGLGWNAPETGPSIELETEARWSETLLGIAAWCTERGVTLHLGCGLPLCLFSTEQLGTLALLKVRLPLARCTPSLVMTLDGRARVCPRLPAEGWVRVPADMTLNELAQQLTRSTTCFTAFCNRAGEQSCRALITGACGGGCMSQNALSWHGAGAIHVAAS